MSDRDDTHPLATELHRLASIGGHECELRNEITRWRWAIAAWELTHTPQPEPIEPDLIAVEGEVVVVFPLLDSVC